MREPPGLRDALERECEISAIRAQGAGGQNVNKVSSAVHLRFDVRGSACLGDAHKQRLLALRDQRLSAEGVLVLKAQAHRSQAMNREEALDRLLELVRATASAPRRRVATRPTLGSQRRRLDGKSRRGEVKRQRGGAGTD